LYCTTVPEQIFGSRERKKQEKEDARRRVIEEAERKKAEEEEVNFLLHGLPYFPYPVTEP
jgi:hypothetical protein